MIDDSRRDWVHIEICHLICSHYHCALLLAESIDDLLESLRSAIYVIAVKLDCIFSAFLVVHSKVPAASDTQIMSCWDDMNKSVILRRKILQQLECAV